MEHTCRRSVLQYFRFRGTRAFTMGSSGECVGTGTQAEMEMASAADENALLNKAVAGDGDALEVLLLRYFARVVAEVSRRLPDDIRGAVSAEDVVQDAMIIAFQRIGSFEPRGEDAFFAWLSRIAEHRLMDAAKALRAAKR